MVRALIKGTFFYKIRLPIYRRLAGRTRQLSFCVRVFDVTKHFTFSPYDTVRIGSWFVGLGSSRVLAPCIPRVSGL